MNEYDHFFEIIILFIELKVINGIKVCQPFDVMYIGDPMLHPTTSNEIEEIKDVLILISQYFNQKV